MNNALHNKGAIVKNKMVNFKHYAAGFLAEKSEKVSVIEIKPTIFSAREISKYPSDAVIHHLIFEEGGFFKFAIRYPSFETNFYALYVGGGSDSEPIYKINHQFNSEWECHLYVQFLAMKENV